MSDTVDAPLQPAPTGELFSRVYLERVAPVQDSTYFRNRLDGYVSAYDAKARGGISAILKREGGLIIPFNAVICSLNSSGNLPLSTYSMQSL
jgi:hypothetical protein